MLRARDKNSQTHGNGHRADSAAARDDAPRRRIRRRARGSTLRPDARTWLGFVGFLIVLLLVALPGRAAAANAPWTCSAFGYLFQNSGVAPPTTVYQVNLATGQYATLGTWPGELNAVGYNTLDNYMYGWDTATDQLVRINSDMTTMSLGTPKGSFVSVTGDFDNAGHLWNLGSNAAGVQSYEEIDLAPGSPTYGQVINSGPSSNPPGLSLGGADWSWITGYLYRVMQTNAGTAHLVRFDPTNGVQTDLGALPFTINATHEVGATFTDAQGDLFASVNDTGYIYRINPTTLQTIKVANGPTSLDNDGAECSNAAIPTITVTKTVDRRAKAMDQFTVALKDGSGATLTSATTSGTGTTASTTDWPVSQGATYTIADAMAPGSPDPLSDYRAGISCVNATTGAKVTPGGSAPQWTLTVTSAAAYKCNITNGPSRRPHLLLRKSAKPRSITTGQDVTFHLRLTNPNSTTVHKVKVCDRMPSGLLYVASTPIAHRSHGEYCWKLGTVRAHKSRTLMIRGEARLHARGTLVNRATATGPGLRGARAHAAVQITNTAAACGSTVRASAARVRSSPGRAGQTPTARIAC